MNIKQATEKIFSHIWKNDEKADMEIVWVYISFLRKKLVSISADSQIVGEKNGSFSLILEK